MTGFYIKCNTGLNGLIQSQINKQILFRFFAQQSQYLKRQVKGRAKKNQTLIFNSCAKSFWQFLNVICSIKSLLFRAQFLQSFQLMCLGNIKQFSNAKEKYLKISKKEIKENITKIHEK